MKLLEFINRESEGPKSRILIMSTLAGIGDSLVLLVINFAAEQISNRALEHQLLFLTLACLALAIYTERYALNQGMREVESINRRVRLRIADKIRRSELRTIETLGAASIHTPLAQYTAMLWDATLALVLGLQSFIIMVLGLAYLAWLSPLSVVFALAFMVASVYAYVRKHREYMAKLQAGTEGEARYFSLFEGLTRGFKEVKLNWDKGRDLHHHLGRVSTRIQTSRTEAGLAIANYVTNSETYFQFLLIALVFLVPQFTEEGSNDIFKITATVLFLAGYLRNFSTAIPLIIKADAAVTSLYEMEERLDRAVGVHAHPEPDDQAMAAMADFRAISLEQVRFRYTDERGAPVFQVGPLDLTVRRGELLFIVGHNGSGKTVLMKLLAGLYYPDAGRISVERDGRDPVLLEAHNYQAYRELFAGVFTDFHLFERLYGLGEVDPRRVAEMLDIMGLADKTAYRDGRLTPLDLSTGQRKRLAFLLAVLEDRPIYLFDELAADQDPGFRRYFYETLLPQLRDQGKTVVAISHDDRYFSVADRVLELRQGRWVAS